MSQTSTPDPGRHARVKELLQHAADLDQAGRSSFLDAECRDDAELRAEVESLLAFSEQAEESFLTEAPAGLGSAAAPLEPGRVHAGRYRIERLLGEGGAGRVYQAWDLLLDLPVALKTLRVVSTAQHRRLLQEARLARLVTHPVACRVYDVGEDEQGLFLTMEQVKGEDLSRVLEREGRLPTERVAEIGVALCEGLAAAHEAGVLHRDLKPANVIVEPGGSVRIVDFGLAASRPRNLAEGLPLGSPAYMAPEQAPPGGEIGPAADLHGVGLILHEALTGRRVFEAPTAVELFEKLRTEVPPRPSSLVEGVDPLLDATIVQALEKDPRARPASAGAMAQSLRASLDSRAALRAQSAPARLPRALTSFVGREEELGAVARLLAEPGLVTLVGPGGAGKSRLALAAASAAEPRLGNSLALLQAGGLGSGDELPHELARLLGLAEAGAESLMPRLRQRLAGQDFLLVLDNCEHLAADCGRFVRELLEALPGLVVLATSRVALSVPGERCLEVGPLPVPPAGAGSEALEHSGVQLFVERARAVVPGFEAGEENLETIVRLCRGLDGLPLALELAAARLRSLSLVELVRRLDSSFDLLKSGDGTAPAHHRSLRALIDWSYDQLAEEEQRLFRRLSIFAGSFGLEAAEAACAGGGLEAETVVDLLSGLVDRSLVLVARKGGQVRYNLLETLRAYGRGRLAEEEAEALGRAHLRHFADAMTELAPRIRSRQSPQLVAGLVEDLPDIRAALAFAALDASTACDGLRLAAGVLGTGSHGARRSELRRPIEAMLEVPGLDCPAAEAAALAHASHLAREAGDAEAAARHAELARERARSVGDLAKESEALRAMAALLSTAASLAESLACAQEALALAVASGDLGQQASCHVALGKVALMGVDRDGAIAEFRKALQLLERAPNPLSEAVVLGNLGAVEMERGNTEEGRELIERSAAVARELGEPSCLLRASINLGCLMHAGGDHRGAVRALAEGAARAHELGNAEAEAVCWLNLIASRLELGDRAGAREACRQGLQLSRDVGWQPQTLDLLESAAWLTHLAGGLEGAARLLGACRRHREESGQASGDGGRQRGLLLEHLAEQLGVPERERLRDLGARLGGTEALDLGLELLG